MLFFTISVLCGVAAYTHAQTAASPAQFRFAVENKFDDTGPGAKRKEFAYKTYSNYDDALIAYATDKDTKLPEADKARAYRKLVGEEEYRVPTRYFQSQNAFRNFPKTIPFRQPQRYRPEELKNYQSQLTRFQPKPVEEYTNSFMNHLRLDTPKILQMPPRSGPLQQLPQGPGLSLQQSQTQSNIFLPKLSFAKKPQFPKPDLKIKGQLLKSFNPNKETPLSQGYFTRESVFEKPAQITEVDQNPEYTYSYGVHDRVTGDSKAAHETREGGTVRGFYTVVDADGKQRTVHYTADDKQGFRAVVQRTDTKQ